MVSASINDDTHTDHHAVVLADDVDGFLHPAAAGHDILRDDELFTAGNLKAAPQNKAACFFLGQFVSPPIITVVRSIAGDMQGAFLAAGVAGIIGALVAMVVAISRGRRSAANSVGLGDSGS